MTRLLHFFKVLQARLTQPFRDRRSVQKSRLESILRSNGMSRQLAKHCAWQFFQKANAGRRPQKAIHHHGEFH